MKTHKYLGPDCTEDLVKELEQYVNTTSIYGLDIETNVTDEVIKRFIHVITIGDLNVQYVINVFDFVDKFGKQRLLDILEIVASPKSIKIIHYAQFEITTFLNVGIRLKNVYDTMLAEYVLTSANYETVNGYYSLENLAYKYSRTIMNKEYQTSFGITRELSEEQILYAAVDVKVVIPIYRMQVDMIKARDDEWVVALENEVVRAFSDIHFNGLKLNQHKWLSNIELAKPYVEEAIAEMHNIIRNDFALRDVAESLGYYYPKGKHTINWRSPVDKAKIFKEIFGIDGATKAFVKGYLKNNITTLDLDLIEALHQYVDNNTDKLSNYLMENHLDKLIEYGMYIPDDTFVINWASPPQRLDMFKVHHPKMTGTGEEDLAELKNPHPLILAYIKYNDKVKLLTTYGEKFIEKHVQSDGKVRTTINQIVRTGRVSSRNPNMQQIPANDDVGTIYRNAFEYDEGWVFVDSDFSSQELCVIAYFSQDPVWQEALSKGQDLHSVCAELVFKDKWKNAADENCSYYIDKSKCKCKGHKPLRNAVKTINFGLAYGMSAYKLSWTMGSSLVEAEKLIKEYFLTFPKIGIMLTNLGRFGVTNGYITTPAPFFRKREFPEWKSVPRYKLLNYLKDSNENYNPILGSIERASKNTPIQGGSADMTKYALILILWYIEDNNCLDKIKLVAQVHDQNTTVCRPEIQESWKIKMTELMEEAAALIIKDGSLKCETNITEVWTK